MTCEGPKGDGGLSAKKLGALPDGGAPRGLAAGVPSGLPTGLPGGLAGGENAGGGALNPGGGLFTGGAVDAAGMVTTVLHFGHRAERPAALSGVRILVWHAGH